TKKVEDVGRFKTPTLRGVALTAPYMHDGSLKTLKDVIEFYNRGGIKNPARSRRMQPLKLSKQEVAQLVAFLKALSRTADEKSILRRRK
ncbi:MAG: cytochrome-c peroxidase, partial [Planctomycetaceae bacterium]